MFVTAVLLAAILGASTWMLLRRFLGSGPKLDIPYLQFDDGDNSDSKYMTQSRSIISRGYREVCNLVMLTEPSEISMTPP